MRNKVVMRSLFLWIHFYVFLIGFNSQTRCENENCSIDLIVFSFDRPLQLYAFLESVQFYITGLNKAYVIYRASNDSYSGGYDQVQQSFPWAEFCKQGANPRHDFKPLTIKATFESPSEYVLFAVDDIVIKDYVDLNLCINYLEQTNAYGFFLRLGKNLSMCYPYGNAAQPLPALTHLGHDIYAWQLGQGRYDWGYPNTVDMTLYRKQDIKNDLQGMHYEAPNSFEAAWSGRSGSVMGRQGLCFEQSKIVNIPLNRVQHEYNNRAMNSFSPQDLLRIFFERLKIEIHALFMIPNTSAHMEYVPTFTVR